MEPFWSTDSLAFYLSVLGYVKRKVSAMLKVLISVILSKLSACPRAAQELVKNEAAL